MVKVYVVYIRVSHESKPRVWAYTDKSAAIEHLRGYEKKRGRLPEARMRTIEF